MMSSAVDHMIDHVNPHTPCESEFGGRIVNGISIVLPLLSAAHSSSGESTAQNLTVLIGACKDLINDVMKEAHSRQISMEPVDEAVVNAACLNTIIMNAERFIREESIEDKSSMILDVLTALSVSQSRMLSVSQTQGMPLTLAASVESASAIAIFVASTHHPELVDKKESIEMILVATDEATKMAMRTLDTIRLPEADIDKINAVITREVTRVMLSVIHQFLSEHKDRFCLKNGIASASHVSQVFITGIFNTSSNWSAE